MVEANDIWGTSDMFQNVGEASYYRWNCKVPSQTPASLDCDLTEYCPRALRSLQHEYCALKFQIDCGQ